MVECELCGKKVVLRGIEYKGGRSNAPYSHEKAKHIPDIGAKKVKIYGCSDTNCLYELTEEEYLEKSNKNGI